MKKKRRACYDCGTALYRGKRCKRCGFKAWRRTRWGIEKMLIDCPYIGEDGCDNNGGKAFKTTQNLRFHLGGKHKKYPTRIEVLLDPEARSDSSQGKQQTKTAKPAPETPQEDPVQATEDPGAESESTEEGKEEIKEKMPEPESKPLEIEKDTTDACNSCGQFHAGYFCNNCHRDLKEGVERCLCGMVFDWEAMKNDS